MATFTTGATSAAGLNRANISYPDNSVHVRRAEYTLLAALVAADVIQMIPVFAGERVLYVTLSTEDCTTAADLTLSVGDGVATAKYLALSAIAQAGGTVRSVTQATEALANAEAVAYTVSDTIDVVVGVGGTGGVGKKIRLEALIAKI
jgi:hypothetical protein